MTRQKKITPREPFTVENARAFRHLDSDECPCQPRAVVINPSGLRITVLMHYPATERGRTKRTGTGLPKGWIAQGYGRGPGMSQGERVNEHKKLNPRRRGK